LAYLGWALASPVLPPLRTQPGAGGGYGRRLYFAGYCLLAAVLLALAVAGWVLKPLVEAAAWYGWLVDVLTWLPAVLLVCVGLARFVPAFSRLWPGPQDALPQGQTFGLK